jgi:hypothetical protein
MLINQFLAHIPGAVPVQVFEADPAIVPVLTGSVNSVMLFVDAFETIGLRIRFQTPLASGVSCYFGD